MKQQDLFSDLNDFSQKFELPQPDSPMLLQHEDMEFRLKFLMEEWQEIADCHVRGDLEGVFDGLIDLTYVAIGTAWLMNLPFNEGWERVHAANMSKVRAEHANDGRSKRKHGWDVVKPEGWKPPVLEDLL